MASRPAQAQLNQWLVPLVRKGVRFPTLDDWAIAPDLSLIIIELIASKRPGLIVELGSGFSTLLIGYALKKAQKGRLITIEHDEHYFAVTTDYVRDHGLEDVVDIWHCPLRPCAAVSSQSMWYDIPLQKLPAAIDMLLVDGPPGAMVAMARYPALPVLRSHFARGIKIVANDASRPDESEVIQRWLYDYPDLYCEVANTERGAAILSQKM